MDKDRGPKRAKDMHVAPGLRDDLKAAIFGKKITCTSCRQGVPRRTFEAHIYDCPAKREKGLVVDVRPD